MIVHDQFVFLQMRKTGCTFVAEALHRELGVDVKSVEGKHADWGRIPIEAAALPVLTYIRNPWDWYVSWYHFNLGMEEPTHFWRMFSAGGRLDFGATLRNAVAVSTPQWGRGFLPGAFRHLCGKGLESERLTVGRFESLADDLEDFLAAREVELPAGAMERIRAGSRINSSERGPYRDYYDEELRDLVGDSCKWLIDRFGYRF